MALSDNQLQIEGSRVLHYIIPVPLFSRAFSCFVFSCYTERSNGTNAVTFLTRTTKYNTRERKSTFFKYCRSSVYITLWLESNFSQSMIFALNLASRRPYALNMHRTAAFKSSSFLNKNMQKNILVLTRVIASSYRFLEV